MVNITCTECSGFEDINVATILCWHCEKLSLENSKNQRQDFERYEQIKQAAREFVDGILQSKKFLAGAGLDREEFKGNYFKFLNDALKNLVENKEFKKLKELCGD